MSVDIIIFKIEFLYMNFWDSSWGGCTWEGFSSPGQALLGNVSFQNFHLQCSLESFDRVSS